MFTVQLTNPTRLFTDVKAGLFLDYYNPRGTFSLITDEVKAAVGFGILRDVDGNLTEALAEKKEQQKLDLDTPDETKKEEAGDDGQEKAEEPAEEKAPAKRVSAKKAPAKSKKN